ncbi:MAG: tRNA lysidine(34) synthetase TilS [Hyphomicrobium sp.]
MAAGKNSGAAPRGTASTIGDEPIGDDELGALFTSLSDYQSLVLAVSGGADSMALMWLARRWAACTPEAPKLVVGSVDHGLRDGARTEAEWVVAEARALGLESALLTWSEKKPATGIQDAARAARYRLLAGLARTTTSGKVAIVTAHTADDQAETMLMRLARGSGLDGLAGMSSLRAADAALPRVDLARPLLGVSGARLRATLRAAGRTWIDDPSNDAEHFERVRVRKVRAVLEELGITNDKIALSGRRLARAKQAIGAAVDALEHEVRLDVHGGAFASFDSRPWRSAPEELRLRLLGRLVTAFGGQAEPLRLAQLEALVVRMAGDGFDGATLAGAIIAPSGEAIHIQREAGRAPMQTLLLAAGTSAVWDHRFRVTSAHAAPGAVEVRALGANAYAQLRQQLDGEPRFSVSVGATLPAFWREAELLYVPALVNLPNARALWGGGCELYSAEFIG